MPRTAVEVYIVVKLEYMLRIPGTRVMQMYIFCVSTGTTCLLNFFFIGLAFTFYTRTGNVFGLIDVGRQLVMLGL